MYFLILMIVAGCGSGTANNASSQPIESRAIEQMSSREAALLGLEYKDSDGSRLPAWVGPELYSMEDAQHLASTTGKKVLIDVYTVWCGYCRKMAAETYSSQKVKSAVNEYYYTVRLDAESEREITFNGMVFTESELAASFGVSSFPTTVFLDSSGEPIGLQPGYMDAEIFSVLLSYVGSDAFMSQRFDDYMRSAGN